MHLLEPYLVGRAILRVLRDSTRTEEIHLVEEITGRAFYRQYLERMRGDPAIEELLRRRPELCSAQVDFEALRALPASSFGAAYVGHLDRNGLSADSQATPATHVAEPDIAYLLRRYRQTHDVWHCLLGLGVEGYEEVLVHAFSLGQLPLPVSALIVVFGAIKHMLLEQRWEALRDGLWDAYRAGREAAPLLPVHWEQMWELPLDEVRARYGVRAAAIAQS